MDFRLERKNLRKWFGKMDKGKVSIVVPAYNAERSIEKCIKSICSQTYRNVEIIIVDDGSSDRTQDICRKLAAEDNRIKLIRQKNLGPSGARNTALKHVKGEFITFVDADDLLIDKSIYYKACKLLNSHRDVDMVIFDWECRDADSNLIIEDSHINKGIVSGQKLAQIIIKDNYNIKLGGGYIWNKVWRTDKLFDKKGKLITFENELFAYEDKLFLLKNLNLCNKILLMNLIAYRYYVSSKSASHDPEKVRRRRKDVIIAHDIGINYFDEKSKTIKKCLQTNKTELIIQYTSAARKSKDEEMIKWIYDSFAECWKAVLKPGGVGIKTRLVWAKNYISLSINSRRRVRLIY